MSDIVERLKMWTIGTRGPALAKEAADEIERLRAALTEIARHDTNMNSDHSVGAYQSKVAREALQSK